MTVPARPAPPSARSRLVNEREYSRLRRSYWRAYPAPAPQSTEATNHEPRAASREQRRRTCPGGRRG
eukprot:435723-Pyramimonas_sp.AAC.1